MRLLVLEKAVRLANPTSPVGETHVGTHNLRKFAYSLAFLYFECSDLQQLCDRAGSRSMAIPFACIFVIFPVTLFISALHWVP